LSYAINAWSLLVIEAVRFGGVALLVDEASVAQND